MSMTTIIIDKVKKILADTVFDINAVVFCSTLGIAVLMTIVSVVITKCRIVMFDVDQTQMSTNTEIAHGPSHGAPQWEMTTHKNATARSPCKDEISFLSVTVSSVLPQSAAAVFF